MRVSARMHLAGALLLAGAFLLLGAAVPGPARRQFAGPAAGPAAVGLRPAFGQRPVFAEPVSARDRNESKSAFSSLFFCQIW